jgi:hypothetical protein
MRPHRNVALGAALCFAALSAVPAAALEGEILIDQAAIAAGGITPGDTPGFPVSINRRGKYKLTEDLAVPPGRNGIEVRAGNVTIDLNGFAIRSVPALQANVGIDAQPSNVENLTVMNGTVVEFKLGGISIGGSFAVVENVRAIFNQFGVQAGTDARIVNSTIASNGNFGVSCSFRCVVEQNVVTATKSAAPPAKGVGVLIGSGVVLGNVIVQNAGFGISSSPGTGFGNNLLFGNNGGLAQTSGASPLNPNVCSPVIC